MIGSLRLPRLSRPRARAGGFAPGLSAIGAKELRSRMRGRRAFIVVTLNLVLLAGYAWMVERISEANQSLDYAGAAAYAAATIGRDVFYELMVLQTLLVAVLAPASTAGAISSEREKQTLDLLAATPISSIAIVVGKLMSALSWIFVLIVSSIPITALVFLFGGVAPDDLVRGYVVLVATAVGLGSVGLFFSALTGRTGPATILTFVVVIGMTVGLDFVGTFLRTTASTTTLTVQRPPEALYYWNPFVAQADVACGAEEGLGTRCQIVDKKLGTYSGIDYPTPGIRIDVETAPPPAGAGGTSDGTDVDVEVRDDFGSANGVRVVEDVAVTLAASFRDRLWPKSVVAWMVLALVLTIASIQLVMPTRRWRPSVPGFLRRPARRTTE